MEQRQNRSSGCSNFLTQIVSTQSHFCAGGLSVPSTFNSSVIFLASDATRNEQSIFMHFLQRRPSSLTKLLQTGSPVPALPNHFFGGFTDAVIFEDQHLGFVGMGNLSAPLPQRLFGAYVMAHADRSERTLHKVADTTDPTPVTPSRRFRSVSTPAIYSAEQDIFAAFAGSDARSGGRELIVRWRLSTRQQTVLLDSSQSGLTRLSSPQICQADVPLGRSSRWLLFFATSANGEPGVWSLALDDSSSGGGGPLPAASSALSGLRRLVAPTDAVPGATTPQTFSAFGAPVAACGGSGGLALFLATGTRGSDGIYAAAVSHFAPLRRLVDTTSTPRGSTARFSGFPHSPTAASGLVVFYAAVAGGGDNGVGSSRGDDGSRSSSSNGGGGSGLYAMRLQGMETRGSGEPFAVATLASTNLSYLIAGYAGFDGRCLAFYGSDTKSDGLWSVEVQTQQAS